MQKPSRRKRIPPASNPWAKWYAYLLLGTDNIIERISLTTARPMITGWQGMEMHICRFVTTVVLLLSVSVAIGAEKSSSGKAMQYGPCLCSSVTFVKPRDHNAATWKGAVTRAMTVALPGEAAICYDLQRLSVAGLWQGGFLDRSNTHHTSYKGGLPPRPGAKVAYKNLNQPGWATPGGALPPEKLQLRGYYLHNNRVVLSYRVADRDVLETPESAVGGLVRRTFRIGAGKRAVSLHIANVAANFTPDAVARGDIKGLTLQTRDGRLYYDVPAGEQPRLFTVWATYRAESKGVAPTAAADKATKLIDPADLITGGSRRWNETHTTRGVLGPNDTAYTLDDMPLPDSPWGSWMRLSAIDFFPDGRMTVATLSGDVWIASFDAKTLEKITWRRFATGLYEPLGMKVVKGKIYVRGRDRITRLHDLNNDGEADFYENFHSAGPIGPGYHAFLFDLVTDKAGSFYFATSGRKAPTLGRVIKISPDGRRREVIAKHFRHPNGLGSGGPHGWITIADNPDGKYPSGASIVRPGGAYGYNGPRNTPMLYIVPPKVDSSAGSQCWTDPKRFGPLSNALIHTSFSTSTLTYVLTQNIKPHPNGFAVRMPWGLKSGAMRAAVNPMDGQMYVACQRGWDTNAAITGIVHRVRYTGGPAYLVSKAAATANGLELTFACPLDPKTVNFDAFYTGRVGGKGKETELEIDEVKLVGDRTVRLVIPALDPADVIDKRATKKHGSTQYRILAPLAVMFDLKAADGTKIKDTVYATVNSR